MSNDKYRGVERRNRLLESSAYVSSDGRFRGILCHREGGMAMKNRDLQKLVKAGLVEFKRITLDGHSFPPKRFPRFWKEIHGQSLVNRIALTRAVITGKGRKALAKSPPPSP